MGKEHRYSKRVGLAFLVFAGLLTSCSSVSSSKAALMKSNEIVTYDAPQEGKEIIRIGFAMPMKWDSFIAALNAKFPAEQFIYDFNYTAGNGIPLDKVGDIVEKNDYDFVVANSWNAPSLGADISDQSFLSNYQATVLDSIKSDGRVYGIPLPTSALGIAYNKTLFAEKGWTYPTSTDEYIALSKTIKAAGITRFDSCFKYSTQLARNLEGMLYDELFTKPEGLAWYQKLIQGKATFAEYATPMFEMAKKLFDEGVHSLSSFSASLTTMRKDFFAGNIAMLDYATDIFALAQTENCPFDVGFGGYPSSTGVSSPVLYSSSGIFYIPKAVKNDTKRFAFDLSVMDYLSTTEGQDAILTGWVGVPSVVNYTGANTLYSQLTPFIKSGSYHPVFDFAADQDLVLPLKNLIRDATESIGKGTSVADAVSALDAAYQAALKAGVVVATYSKIGEAKEDFTVLETSYYMADKIKAATQADVAVVASGGYYRSNMGYFSKGDISDDPRLFYEKSVGAKDYITTYSLTGEQLKTLLEKPIISGVVKDQFLAPAGLKLTYAPWHKQGNRLVAVSLEDGTASDETKLYTVASYAGLIDASYLSATIKSYPELLDPQSFILASVKADQTISPNVNKRLLLNWDIEK